FLVLNQFNDVVAGTGVSAIGILTDTDANLGLDARPITFTGTGATNLLSVNTQGISFNDVSGLTVDSSGILHLHQNSFITFPPGTVGVSLTLQGMGTNGFQVKVTNTAGVAAIYSGAATAPDITTFSPPSDTDGISRIDIVSIVGGDPSNFAI